MTAHRIDGHDRPLDRQHVQQLGNCHELVGLFRHFHLAEHQALACRERRDHVDRGLGALLLVGPTRGLSIDGNHPLRCPGQRRDPGNEAALELLGVERCKDIAEVIMRRRPIAKWPEPAQ